MRAALVCGLCAAAVCLVAGCTRTAGNLHELNSAALDGDLGTMMQIIEKEPRLVNQIGKEGAPPLHWAVQSGSPDKVKYLLKNGARIDTVDINGQTALHWAAYFGNVEIVKILLAAGAAVNVQDETERTPLFMAVAKNNRDVQQLLIENGAQMK